MVHYDCISIHYEQKLERIYYHNEIAGKCNFKLNSTIKESGMMLGANNGAYPLQWMQIS